MIEVCLCAYALWRLRRLRKPRKIQVEFVMPRPEPVLVAEPPVIYGDNVIPFPRRNSIAVLARRE